MFGTATIWQGLRAVPAWANPKVAPEIQGSLQNAQFISARRQVPMLLSVAQLNTVIIMAVCAHNELPLGHYAWMSGIVLYCVIRRIFWKKQLAQPVPHQDVPRLLRTIIWVSLTLLLALGFGAAYSILNGLFSQNLLIPMSLGFGSVSIAHCLYTLRPVAIGAVVLGIVPTSIAMILVGDFDAIMNGVVMLSVAVLMIRFVTEQYDQLILSLHLEQQIRELANTDPLTGLANRRAIMAELDAAFRVYETEQKCFGVALLDLDGFKQVNDELGHNAGDVMLQKVAERLSGAAVAGDTVGRLGGDEFIILMRGVDQENEISARTTAMMAALCQPALISGKRLAVAASLGFARFPQDGESIDAMLHAADTALYAAKRRHHDGRRRKDFGQSVAVQ